MDLPEIGQKFKVTATNRRNKAVADGTTGVVVAVPSTLGGNTFTIEYPLADGSGNRRCVYDCATADTRIQRVY